MLTHISDPILAKRFLNEARVQASLNHKNIAILHDFLEVGGHPCIIMEYVGGKTLLEHIKACDGLPIPETVNIFRALVEAICYMHDHGIIHRDIKPSNVKLSPEGQLKLLDFGIAKADYSPRLTKIGDIVGTPLYLAPEQLRGKPVDIQTDIWSLGVLLYQTATGKSPYGSTELKDLPEKIIKADYLPPAAAKPGLPRQLTAIIDRCLQRDPSERYRSARSLLHDIGQLAGSPLPLVEPAKGQKSEHAPLAVIRSYWPVGVSVAVLLLMLGLNLFSTPQKPFGEVVVPSASNHELAQEKETSAQDLRSVRISVLGTPAEIYFYQDGRWAGPFNTPYEFRQPLGRQVAWMLKSPGYQDKRGYFTVQSVNPM